MIDKEAKFMVLSPSKEHVPGGSVLKFNDQECGGTDVAAAVRSIGPAHASQIEEAEPFVEKAEGGDHIELPLRATAVKVIRRQ